MDCRRSRQFFTQRWANQKAKENKLGRNWLYSTQNTPCPFLLWEMTLDSHIYFLKPPCFRGLFFGLVHHKYYHCTQYTNKWIKGHLSLSLFTFMHWRRKWQPTPVLAWRIPGTGEPGGLPSTGPHRVGHDWSDFSGSSSFFAVLVRICWCKQHWTKQGETGTSLMVHWLRIHLPMQGTWV